MTRATLELSGLRVLAILFLLLLAPQGSRPSSILELKFSNLEVRPVRDFNNPSGRLILVIRLGLEYTKQHLRKKATKHFRIPEIIYNMSLLHNSSHVFLLAILFCHRAFDSEGLSDNPHLLSQLKVHSSGDQLKLCFKHSIKNTYIFRRVVKRMISF
ncbi:hypothetical protein HD806DRAFT_355315 [Xylariaceae sp. AK1471]|nr:hypothetical protein HD806DRAFT_355315 [Xylariaceae sp. AK1471]